MMIKNFLERYAPLCLAALLLLFLSGCGGAPSGADAPSDTAENVVEDSVVAEETTDEVQLMGSIPEEVDPVEIRLAALKGPTAMGLVKLISDVESGETAYGNYAFTLAASPDEVSPLLIQGQLDIACVPANLAAVLHQRTDGEIITLAVNTLGVLYLVERGNAVQNMDDLRGMTIAASGKGSSPEYVLRYLLEQNGLNPETDLTIDWKSEHSECVAALASGAATVALLPQPFVSAAMRNVEDLRVAIDLTREWDALRNGSALITGVAAARRSFVEEHPSAVARFLEGYAVSTDWVNANVSDAAALIGAADIVPAPVAELAIPYCNIVCMTGDEMADALSGYLSVLYDAAPESVGGALPDVDFYYRAAP